MAPRMAGRDHGTHEHSRAGQRRAGGGRAAPHRPGRADRPRPPPYGGHRPREGLLLRRAGLRRGGRGARHSGLGHDGRHPVRLGRRLPPPPRLQHVEVGGRRPAARRGGRPPPRRARLPDPRRTRRRRAPPPGGRRAAAPALRPRHPRGRLPVRSRRQRPRAGLGPARRAVARRRRRPPRGDLRRPRPGRPAQRALSRRTPTADSASSAIVADIGRAVPVPAIPASGAAAAPIVNWRTPIRAEALPATSGWPASASAMVLGNTRPMLATSTHSGTSSVTSGSEPTATTANTAQPATAIDVTPIRSIVSAATRPASRPLSWPATTMPTLLTAKTAENACGEAP